MAGPQHVSHALAELISLKGLARVQAHAELQSVWAAVAGEQIAAQTKVLGVRRGVLQVSVSNSALLSELVSFHKQSLVKALRTQQTDLRLKDIKFRLKGEL
jgi:predicted nucleic acid-binding Zn ribbon protein